MSGPAISSQLRISPQPTGLEVRVAGREAYPIHVGQRVRDCLPGVLERLCAARDASSAHVITDVTVAGHHLPAVRDCAERAGLDCTVHVVGEGERAKSLPTLTGLWHEMHRTGASRRSLVVGLGGGVVCDLTALAAATYMRGLPYLLIPTSLVAQADAAIGGKGGIDFEETKNLIGAFYHPAAVIVDPALLATLDHRHLRNGMSEIIKLAVVADERLLRLAESASPDAMGAASLSEIISRAIGQKLLLLADDPLERRFLERSLNFGHCIGHPLEAANEFRILHGEAVAAGMAAATSIGTLTGYCPADDCSRVLDVLARYGLPTGIPPQLRAATWHRMAEVRRVRNGRLNLVVPHGIGSYAVLKDIGRTEYEHCLARLDTWQARQAPPGGQRR